MQAYPTGAQHALGHGRAPAEGLAELTLPEAAELSGPAPPLDMPRSLPSLSATASGASSRAPEPYVEPYAEPSEPWHAGSEDGGRDEVADGEEVVGESASHPSPDLKARP